MKIRNIDGLSATGLQQETDRGTKFVSYAFIISPIIFTFKRTSGVYLVRSRQNAVAKGAGFTALSFLFGWWGIPFGHRYTIESILTNLKGENDVTDEVMATVAGHILYKESQQRKKATSL